MTHLAGRETLAGRIRVIIASEGDRCWGGSN